MRRSNPEFASDMQNPANGSPMLLTLRKLLVTICQPGFWIIIVSIVFLTALAGPYFTLERLSFPERLVYWGTTIVISAVVMTFLSGLAYSMTEAHGWNWAVVSLISGLVGVIPVTGSIYLAEGVASGFASGWLNTANFGSLVKYVAPSVVAVTLVVNLIIEFQQRDSEKSVAGGASAEDATPALTLLQSKLPHHLGHNIVSVQAQDHYVEVTTSKGSAMVLMRLGDAVKDLTPLGGMQVHRSWWVNLEHIVSVDKTPNGPSLVLTSTQRVVVGRSFRAAFRKAMLE